MLKSSASFLCSLRFLLLPIAALILTALPLNLSYAQFPGSPLGTVTQAIKVHRFWKDVYDRPSRIGFLVLRIHERYHSQHSYAGLSSEQLYDSSLFVRPPEGKKPEIEVFPGTLQSENDAIRFVIHNVNKRRCEKLFKATLLDGAFKHAQVNGHPIDLPYRSGCAERLKGDVADGYSHGEDTMELFFE